MEKLFVAIIVIAIVIAVPFGIIWSINTLFATGIPFTLKTWGAALILAGSVGGNRSSPSSK